jgi:hypothetical protein
MVPERPQMTAPKVLGDLSGRLDDQTADALTAAVKRTKKDAGGSLKSLRNPWVS